MESHLLAVLGPLPHLPGGVVASAGVRRLQLDQLVAVQAGDSLALPPVRRVLIKLLAQLELNLGVLEACQGLWEPPDYISERQLRYIPSVTTSSSLSWRSCWRG